MTINLDSDLVSTKFDSVKQVCIYTARQGLRQWTAEIPVKELNAYAGNKMMRRQIVTRYLQSAMNGPSDNERQA